MTHVSFHAHNHMHIHGIVARPGFASFFLSSRFLGECDLNSANVVLVIRGLVRVGISQWVTSFETSVPRGALKDASLECRRPVNMCVYQSIARNCHFLA